MVLIMGLPSFSNVFGATPENKFWKWFKNNEEMLFNFEKDVEAIFDKLAHQMQKVNSDLTFEFGPINDNGKREFVISAGGIKTAFPSVESLYEAAPESEKWIFVKYRQRKNPLNDLEYEGVSVDASEVHYKLYKDGDKLGIVLFLDGYNEEQNSLFGSLGFLFLDEALGEFDIETKVGFIEFHGRDSEQYDGASKLEELSAAFDEYFQNGK